ncbi:MULTISPECIES: DUF1573 domain-containing protein [Myroides]|uniref:DUF1573 domain-containing protein n=1 Tax=Myroides albus TaxID=2562892 RepID=A0A6I3LIR0_9FLAO|nr:MULTISPECIES: DUF1573 domain-containing protein [Myroides]MTG97704.1 DUF1573 domain-containing protein [Myroides albus]MVX34654.1 DUF1573 domain-containing protein [Myroides sp. LoEW2-1]UVD78750.1 DUF1573 domain-containing protein [Myroides albus]
MKKSLLLICTVALFAVACDGKKEDATKRIDVENANKVESQVKNTKFPKVKFDRLSHDFGNVKNNDAVYTEFELTNVGEDDLVIINAEASCGCTVPEYQKTPIKPGETSKIKVRFQQSQQGLQQKTITLTTNTENVVELLTIQANVAPRD